MIFVVSIADVDVGIPILDVGVNMTGIERGAVSHGGRLEAGWSGRGFESTRSRKGRGGLY